MTKKPLPAPAQPLQAGRLPDPRLNAYRPNLADERLRDRVEARHYTAGIPARIAAPVADLYQAPPRRRRLQTDAPATGDAAPARAGAESQLLYGAAVRVFSRGSGYAWVQAEADSYVGYVRISALLADDAALLLRQPSHYIAVPRSFLYSEADLRAKPIMALSMGSQIHVAGEETRRGTAYALLNDGTALIAAHLRPIGDYAADYVAVAESLLHTPYLWGGASAFGIDCSGLVQLSLAMAGQRVLRDSDMQAETIGALLQNAEQHDRLERGDLVFWRGHVAIMLDKERIIHANGRTMRVSIEPLAAAIERIARATGSRPIAYRRLPLRGA